MNSLARFNRPLSSSLKKANHPGISSQHLRSVGTYIRPTVEKAKDTSKMTFQSVGEYSVQRSALLYAKAFKNFYIDPESLVKLDEEDKKRVRAELLAYSKSLPTLEDYGLDEEAKAKLTAAGHIVTTKADYEKMINDMPIADVYRLGDIAGVTGKAKQ